MALKQIKTLMKVGRYEKALAEAEKMLEGHPECPHLWNLRGDLIQLLDHQHGPPLAEAEASYLRALKLNRGDFDATESLAHFYDVVNPQPTKARRYAKACIDRAARTMSNMQKILANGA